MLCNVPIHRDLLCCIPRLPWIPKSWWSPALPTESHCSLGDRLMELPFCWPHNDVEPWNWCTFNSDSYTYIYILHNNHNIYVIIHIYIHIRKYTLYTFVFLRYMSDWLQNCWAFLTLHSSAPSQPLHVLVLVPSALVAVAAVSAEPWMGQSSAGPLFQLNFFNKEETFSTRVLVLLSCSTGRTDTTVSTQGPQLHNATGRVHWDAAYVQCVALTTSQ